MRLTFLGTAAAEGYPGIFCDCDNCNEARALGGRSLRFRSALLINDDLMIDFGPDVLAAAQRFNLNLSRVSTLLVTHAHSDHFYLGNFMMRHPDFTSHLPIPALRVFGPREVAAELGQMAPDLSLFRTEINTVHAFDAWQVGPYTFRAYHAYHAIDTLETLFYAVDDGQRSFLYATDTGPFPVDTWQALEGASFDAIILEETMGEGTYSQHIGFADFIKTSRRMQEMGMLRPGGRLVAHHFSHTSNPTHEKLEAILGPHGAEIAFDGLEIHL